MKETFERTTLYLSAKTRKLLAEHKKDTGSSYSRTINILVENNAMMLKEKGK